MEKHLAVIGDPVAHSLSPVMHEAGFRARGIDARYYRFQVKPGELKEAVQGLRALGFSGWNVTIPHKEQIIPYLDDLTPDAQRAGSVNTVKNHNGVLIGHNTDGLGLVRSLQADCESLRGKEAVILGAGGAARGIAFALSQQGMRLKILNRTLAKARNLAILIRNYGGEADYGELLPGKWLESVDLLIQTTAVGLKGETFPISLKGISPSALIVDIIFNPCQTPFLREAAMLGCRTQNGLGMLLHQGALAWEFWFGIEAPVDAMKEALYRAIQCGERH